MDWFDGLTDDQRCAVNSITEVSFASDDACRALLLNSLDEAGIDLGSWHTIVKDANYGLQKWIEDIRQLKIAVEDGSLHSWRQ